MRQEDRTATEAPPHGALGSGSGPRAADGPTVWYQQPRTGRPAESAVPLDDDEDEGEDEELRNRN